MVLPRLHPTRRSLMPTELDLLDPSTISSLLLWYDADDNSTILNSGGSPASSGEEVHTWKNKTTRLIDVDLEPADPASPPLFTNAAVNGRSVVRYTWGVLDELLAETAADDIISDYPCSIFTVAASNDTDQAQSIVSLYDNAVSNEFCQHWIRGNESGDPIYLNFRNGTTPHLLLSTSTQYFSGVPFVMSSVHTDADLREVWVDGAKKITNTDTATWPGEMDTIGLPGVKGFGGDICEVLVFDAALGSSVRKNVEEYLSIKWGVEMLG